MKTLFLMIALALCQFSFTPAAKHAPEAMAVAKWKNVTMDFGKLKHGAPCEASFEFTNTGKVPLIIQNVAASCGCTTPYFSKEPVQPGKQGKVTLKYDSNRIGSFTKTATVTANVAEQNFTLTIKGEIQAPESNQAN